jgi:DNA mismatch repair protein MSH5
MQINMDALLSLQIFLDERHASAYSDVTKEGLSVFGDCQEYRPFCMLIYH